jgi:DNA invertase Pin-like site-specific DNA recombinase
VRTDGRPGLDKALREAVQGRYDALAVWSVDRLGRSLQDLLPTLSELQGAGCNLYLHRQAIDTRTPSGCAMFQMLGVFAEFERAMIVERVRSGIARARVKARSPADLSAGRELESVLSERFSH